MASTASINVIGSVVGLPEGASDSFNFTLTNSSAAGLWTQVTATTVVGTAPSVATLSSARYLVVIPLAGGVTNLRVTNTTAENGIILSTAGANVLSIVGGSTYYFWSAGTAQFTVRVGQF